MSTYPIEMFQSAPLTDVRGDKVCSAFEDKGIKFQSAPLTDVRGDSDFRLSIRPEF